MGNVLQTLSRSQYTPHQVSSQGHASSQGAESQGELAFIDESRDAAGIPVQKEMSPKHSVAAYFGHQSAAFMAENATLPSASQSPREETGINACNENMPDDKCLLTDAFKKNNPEIVKEILASLGRDSQRWNALFRDQKFCFELQKFAVGQDSLSIIEILLANQVHPDQCRGNGSLLDMAIEEGRTAIVEASVKALFARKSGYFPALLMPQNPKKNLVFLLHFAIQKNNLNLTNSLLANCADPTQKDSSAVSALVRAIRDAEPKIVEALFATLLEKNKDYFNPSSSTATPLTTCRPELDFAIDRGDLDIVNIVLKSGANPIERYDGVSALEKAIKAKKPEIVAALIGAVQDKNYFTSQGFGESSDKLTMLLNLASEKGDSDTLHLLLICDEDLNRRSQRASGLLDRMIEKDDAEKVGVCINQLIIKNSDYFSFKGDGIRKIREAVSNKKYKAAQKMRHTVASQLFPGVLVWFGKLVLWFWAKPIFNFEVKLSSKNLFIFFRNSL